MTNRFITDLKTEGTFFNLLIQVFMSVCTLCMHVRGKEVDLSLAVAGCHFSYTIQDPLKMNNLTFWQYTFSLSWLKFHEIYIMSVCIYAQALALYNTKTGNSYCN